MDSSDKNIKIDNGTITDEYGELWVQETATAWRRESDRLWWEGLPISNDNVVGHKPPRVKDVLRVKT